MKLKNHFNFMLALIIALPLFTILVSSLIMFLYWYASIDDSDDIQAPRFIRPALKDIFEGRADDEFNGVILVLDHMGETIYLSPPVEEYIEPWGDMDSTEFYQRLMKEMPEQPFGFSVYIYQGNPGVVMYLQENFFKLRRARWVWPMLLFFYGGFILLPALGLNFMIRPIMSSLLNMERGAIEIGKGNLEHPIEVHQGKRGGLRELEQAMENMRQELKENHERNSRIIMSISHDLKTPLTSIKGYVEAIEDGMAENPEDLKRYTQIIQDKTSLLEERITELIHFSKLRTTDWQSRFAPIDMEEFLKETMMIFRNDAMLVSREFQYQIDFNEGIQILGDQKMLFQVLENLFDNSCRYNPKEVKVRFHGEVKEGMLRLLLEDSGPGIPEEHREKIFETFYRGDPGRNSRGMGIGLASAQMIIQSHGGSISYQPGELGGAGFLITLPLLV